MSCECNESYVCCECETTYRLQAKDARNEKKIDDLIAFIRARGVK